MVLLDLRASDAVRRLYRTGMPPFPSRGILLPFSRVWSHALLVEGGNPSKSSRSPPSFWSKWEVGNLFPLQLLGHRTPSFSLDTRRTCAAWCSCWPRSDGTIFLSYATGTPHGLRRPVRQSLPPWPVYPFSKAGRLGQSDIGELKIIEPIPFLDCYNSHLYLLAPPLDGSRNFEPCRFDPQVDLGLALDQ